MSPNAPSHLIMDSEDENDFILENEIIDKINLGNNKI
jgi:hypothetical protein